MKFTIVCALMIISFVAALHFHSKKGNRVAGLLSVFFLIIATACGVMLPFVYGVFGKRIPQGPELNTSLYESSRAYVLGKYLAENHPHGRALVITGWMDENKDIREEQVEELKKTLEPDLFVVAVEKLDVKKYKQGSILLSDKIGAREFDSIIEKHPECNIVITAIGLPDNAKDMEFWTKNSDSRPLVALLDGNISMLGWAIKDRLLVAAIAKPYWTYDKNISEDPFKRFEQRYLLVDSKNLDDVLRNYKNVLRVKE